MDYIFDKYQGAGNDFILIDARSRSFKSMNQFQINSICKRNFGIGSDGLILIKDHKKLDFEMITNPVHPPRVKNTLPNFQTSLLYQQKIATNQARHIQIQTPKARVRRRLNILKCQ